MKIAYFTDTYYPQLNGVATVVGYFIKALKKKGIIVHLFAPKIKGYKDVEENIHRLPSIRALPNLPDSIRLPLPIPHKSFWRMVKDDFDLVHAHGNGIFSLLGLIAARYKKVPFVLTFHTQVSQFSHYFFKGKIVKPNLLNNILLKRFGNLCDGIIAPSEKMKQELIRCGVKKHIEVIPNFVDLDKFNTRKNGFLRQKYHLPQNSLIILSVGRLGKEKNFEFLISLFGKITIKNPQVYLIIVGEGSDEKKLKKLIRKLNLGKKVILTGGIANDKMPQVYNSADLFVFPSVSEIHPMVAIEAAASGLPLVVARDRAYEGIVIDNKNGYILPLDQDIFAEKITSLLDNSAVLKKMAAASPGIVKKNFNPEKLISNLIKFYDLTIQNYRPSARLGLSRSKQL